MTDPEVINMLQKIDRSLDADADINDDEKVFYGDDNDFSERYDSSTDEFRTMDEINDQDVVGVTKSRDVKHFGDTLYPNIGGSPTFSGHDHSETGTSAVSNSGLVNSTVTYSPGVGINGAGSVGLGGSATIDVGPDDDEAIPWGTDDDIEVTYVSAQDAIEFIDPTGPTPRVRVSRTGPFELVNSNLRIATGQSIEDGGGTSRISLMSDRTRLRDDTGSNAFDIRDDLYDMSLNASDLRLATGQSIEDGGGNKRVDFTFADETRIYDGTGQIGLSVLDTITQLNAYNGSPVGIRDNEGGFTAVQYFTSASTPSTLELTNAELSVFAGATDEKVRLGEVFDGGASFNGGGNGGGGADVFADGGELKGRDNNDNITTLT